MHVRIGKSGLRPLLFLFGGKMLVCLIEAEANVIKPILPKFVGRFPAEYVVHVRSKKLPSDKLASLKQRPLLCEQWCVVLHNTRFPMEVALQLAQKNFVVWQVEKKQEALQLRAEYEDLKIIDNGKVKKEEVVAWVKSELSNVDGRQIIVDDDDAEYLYNRTDGYLDYLVQAVNTLKFELGRSTATKLSSTMMRRYVDKVSPIKKYHVRNILLGQPCHYHDEVIVSYLAKRAYDWKNLKEYLLDEVKRYEEIFSSEITGELSVQNVQEYLKQNSNVDLQDLQVKKILQAHNEISYEWLLFLEMYLTGIETDALGACEFCSFLLAVRKARVRMN